MWGIVFALAVVIGSCGPWATVGSRTVEGFESGGAAILVVGFVALVLVAVRRRRVPRLWSATFILGLCFLSAAELFSLGTETQDVSFAWGLYLTLVGSGALAVWSVATVATSPTVDSCDWADVGFKIVSAFVLLGVFGDALVTLDREPADRRAAAAPAHSQQGSSSDARAAPASTPTSDSGVHDCGALGMGNDEGGEGLCTGPDGETTFQIVNGDSALVLEEISVRDVAVRMMPVIAGDARAPVRASGRWARITMTIRNEGREPFQLNPLMFDLGVSTASFTPDRRAMQTSRSSCLWKARTLPPGRKTTCWVAFDVDRKHADDVTHSGAVIVYQPSDYEATKASQPIGLVRLRDAEGGTGSAP